MVYDWPLGVLCRRGNGDRKFEENFATIFENNIFERTKPLFEDWRFSVVNNNPNQANRWPVWAVREGDWKLYVGKNDNRIELYNIVV